MKYIQPHHDICSGISYSKVIKNHFIWAPSGLMTVNTSRLMRLKSARSQSSGPEGLVTSDSVSFSLRRKYVDAEATFNSISRKVVFFPPTDEAKVGLRLQEFWADLTPIRPSGTSGGTDANVRRLHVKQSVCPSILSSPCSPDSWRAAARRRVWSFPSFHSPPSPSRRPHPPRLQRAGTINIYITHQVSWDDKTLISWLFEALICNRWLLWRWGAKCFTWQK